MSRRNNILATFERKAEIDDYFAGERDSWVEVCRAWVSIGPVPIFAQRTEFENSDQTTSTRKSIVKTIWTTEAAAITTDCRMKLEKPTPEVPEDPADDANFRIFGIDQVMNAGEQNRQLELMVLEQP